MNLQLDKKLIIVGGATSGFGKAVTEVLLAEGATVIGIARDESRLNDAKNKYGNAFEPVTADITDPASIEKIKSALGERTLYGVLMNAGGPPAKTVEETTLDDWDDAYKKVLRWKVALTKSLLPGMITSGVGRFVFIESASVKQPMENLVLSNSLRAAVVGFVKTLSNETAGKGVTFNILAPGSHTTAAIERTIAKKIEQSGQSREQTLQQMAKQTTVGKLGSPEDFASLAAWLFSPFSSFINGQTISVDGGSVRGIMG